MINYVGIIGFGIGRKHLEAIHNYKNFKVKYVCDLNKKIKNKLKIKYPNIIFTNHEDEIFSDKEIKLVSIASYDQFHFNQIKKCILFNKHIIVEKPMCLTFDELKIIKSMLSKKKTIKIMSNLVLRTNNLFNIFKSKISKKNIFFIEADYLWGREHKLYEWRSSTKKYSLTLGAGIHMIDLVMWLLNSRPISVNAFSNNKMTKNSVFKKDSLIVAICKFPKNILVKISANAVATYDHFHELKIFSKNYTYVNSLYKTFELKKNKKSFDLRNIKAAYPDKKNRKKLIRNFLDYVFFKDLTKKNNFFKKNQFDLMSVCFAIDKSIKNRREVKIKYL